jgi:hypothetical protein
MLNKSSQARVMWLDKTVMLAKGGHDAGIIGVKHDIKPFKNGINQVT